MALAPTARKLVGVLIAVCVACLTLAGAALAQRVNFPPGHSGVQEYMEIVPGGSGGRSGDDVRHQRKLAQRGTVNGPLQALGAEGRQAAALAAATAPDRKHRKRGAVLSAQARSPAPAALGRLAGSGDGGGSGILLPLLLGLTAIAALTYVLRRRSA